MDELSVRQLIYLCCSDFDTCRLFTIAQSDIRFAAWLWNHEKFLGAWYIQINAFSFVIVFAGLPVQWAINTAALEL